MEKVNMISGKDLIAFLKKKGFVNEANELLIPCMYCKEEIDVNKIQFIVPPDNNNKQIRLVCSKPFCIESFLSEKR